MPRLSIVPEELTVTMKTKTWLVLVGVLSTVRDEAEVVDLLMTKIMDEIDG